jgi:hypothetical protein
MFKDSYEEEFKDLKQYDELSAFCCQILSDFTSWDKFQLAIQYVLSKGVVIHDTKWFDDIWHLQKCVKETKKTEFSSFLPHEKLAEYFSKGNNNSNHPELVKLVGFCFAIPTYTGNIESFVRNAESMVKREK